MKPCIIAVLLVLSQPSWAMSKKSPSNYTNDAIGVKTLQYQDTERNRPIIVEFWYPTDEQRTETGPANTDNEVWVHPKEIRNANFSHQSTQSPLILMSHGHRGDRRERTWLVDFLVRKGFLVASIEHYGNSWYAYDPVISCRFWDRAKDISFALNQLLQEETIQAKIDPSRIGFIGYSMGGMTGLALAGAQAKIDLNAIAQQLQKEIGSLASTSVTEQFDLAEAEKSYYEPRIRSMLLICPAAFVYRPENLQKIKVPLGIIASLEDEVLPFQDHAEKIIKNTFPKKVKLMKNKTSHYAFLNKMTEKGYHLLQKAVSKATASQNWDPVHHQAADFTLEFFNETLNQSK